jgi:4'-phosphopantetheinyl transferase EntD
MPLFYQQDINDSTRLGVWLIREPESFFQNQVPLQREITHPHKRLQHLAGRYLLHQLAPGFPYDLIRIADTRKPFLVNEAYHFSISHCAEFAAAIISQRHRVGIDVELSTPVINRVLHKFLHPDERELVAGHVPGEFVRNFRQTGGNDLGGGLTDKGPISQEAEKDILPTLLWSAKESVFKWYGDGGVDFSEHIRLRELVQGDPGRINGVFLKQGNTDLTIWFKLFGTLCLSWVCNDYTG